MSDKVLLSLIISPQIEDAVVDFLLEHEAINGFTSYAINGHGVSVYSLTPAEQVSGYQQQIEFKSYLDIQQVSGLLEAIKSSFGDTGIHYWVIPIIEAGRIE